MRMTGIGLIAAAALAGSIGVAVAQTSTTTTSERGFSRHGEMLGYCDETGAQRDAGHEYRQQHQQHERQQHPHNRICFDF